MCNEIAFLSCQGRFHLKVSAHNFSESISKLFKYFPSHKASYRTSLKLLTPTLLVTRKLTADKIIVCKKIYLLFPTIYILGHSKYYLCFALPCLLGFGPIFEKKNPFMLKKNALCFFVS